MRKMPRKWGAFMKGALRFKRLEARVLRLGTTDQPIRWWYIATSATGPRPGQAARAQRFGHDPIVAHGNLLFTRESIVAVTDTEVLVGQIKGAGVFSANLDADSVTRAPVGSVHASFDPDEEVVEVDGSRHKIFEYHEHDALQVLHRLGAQLPEWFTPA